MSNLPYDLRIGGQMQQIPKAEKHSRTIVALKINILEFKKNTGGIEK